MLRPALLALILLASGIAGCLAAPPEPVAPAAFVDPATDVRGVSSYLHNLSEPDKTITVVGSIVTQLRIPVADGLLLDTWVVRPPGDGPFPVVLEVTPYYGGGSPVNVALGTHELGRLANELVPRGYAVGISSVRGTGNSEGCFTQGGPSEASDTAAVIEYVASQPWANGRVGLIGVSYPGTTPQDVWVEAPPSLKTIVPISGISDLYKYNFVNGVPINIQGFGFNTYYWGMVGVSPAGLSGGAQPTDPFSVPGAVAGEACEDQVDVQEGGVSSTLDGNKDAYWQARDFLRELNEHAEKPHASVFYIHGLQDWNVKPHNMEDWLPAIQASGVPYKVWLGQWGHAWPDRNDWWNITLVAWFDQFLKEIDTGILDAPAVQVRADDGLWRHENEWPPANVEWLTLHPTESGALATEPGTGVARYHDAAGGLLPDALTMTALGPTAAVFISEPVNTTLHISGLPRYEGIVTASGQRASLVFTLMEETPGGKRRALNFGAQSLNHVASLEAGKSNIAGLEQEVGLNFFPQDDVIKEGSRIVLIASGNTLGNPSPSLQPVSDGSIITLKLEGAAFMLPIDRTIVVEEPQPYDEK